MNYEILSSNSKGNCIIVEDILMLDCGISYSKIKPYIKNVKLIFISHSHQDHLNKTTIKQVIYNYPNIKYLTGSKEVVKKLIECKVYAKNIYLLKSGRWFDLGLLKVKLEELIHDTPNYALKVEYRGKKILYVVDTSQISHIEAKNYDLYLIEANYDKEILEKHIQECIDNNDNDKLIYLNRVPYTHLSDADCTSFLIENMGKNSEYVKIHKSQYNYKEE